MAVEDAIVPHGGWARGGGCSSADCVGQGSGLDEDGLGVLDADLAEADFAERRAFELGFDDGAVVGAGDGLVEDQVAEGVADDAGAVVFAGLGDVGVVADDE